MADIFSKSKRSRIMAAIRSKHTRPEMAVRRLVHSMGHRYRLHVRSLPGTPDLVFPAKRKIIEVCGCFWHAHRCRRGSGNKSGNGSGSRGGGSRKTSGVRMPATNAAFWRRKLEANKARDIRTRRALRRAGWRVLVVWECQTRDAEKLAARLREFMRRP